MKIKTLVITVIISVVVSLGSVVGYLKMTEKKIAFVRTGYILSEFQGMKDANQLYESERGKVQANIDTLKSRYIYLQGIQAKTSGSKAKEIAYKLGVAESDYNSYAGKAMEQLEQRRIQLTNDVIIELNSTIEEFGRRNHFKVILGATDDGSLLYGEKSDDISEKILKILNSNYKPKADR